MNRNIIHSKRKRISYILIFAFIVGFIYALPNVLYMYLPPDNFKGIAFVNSLDEWAYTGYVREAAEGNLHLRHQYLYEPKTENLPGYMTLQPVSALISGAVLRAVNMDMNLFSIIQKFLIPALLFWGLFCLLKNLNCSDYISISGAFAALLIPAIFGNNFVLFDLGGFTMWHLIFARPISNIAVLFLIFSINFLVSYIKNLKVSGLWLTAIFGSLAMQSYLFSGIAFYVILGCYLIYFLIKKNYFIAKKIFLIYIISFILSGWVWYNLYGFYSLHKIFNTMNFRYPHSPYFSYYIFIEIIILILTFVLIRRYKISEEIKLFVLIIPLSHIICVNHQIITGLNLEPHHFDIIFYPLLTWAVITVIFQNFILNNNLVKEKYKSLNKNKRTILIIATSFFIIAGVIIIYLSKYFPRPTGGILGHIIRGGTEIYEIVFTLFILLVFYLLVYLSGKNNKLKTFPILYVIIIALITQYFSFIPAFDKNYFSNQMQPYSAAFNWLEKNTEKESVVLCTPLVGDFLTSYTSNNIYFSDYSMQTNPNEFRKRFFNQIAFSGIEPDSLRAYLTPSSGKFDITMKFCNFYWRDYGNAGEVVRNRGRYLEVYSKNDIDKVVNDYSNFLKNWTLDTLKNYRTDYVLYGPIEGNGINEHIHNWLFRNIDKYNLGEPLYDDGIVKIYKLIN